MDTIADGSLALGNIGKNEMVADFLTKPPHPMQFILALERLDNILTNTKKFSPPY